MQFADGSIERIELGSLLSVRGRCDRRCRAGSGNVLTEGDMRVKKPGRYLLQVFADPDVEWTVVRS